MNKVCAEVVLKNVSSMKFVEAFQQDYWKYSTLCKRRVSGDQIASSSTMPKQNKVSNTEKSKNVTVRGQNHDNLLSCHQTNHPL
jgi:hypothetical protein